MLVCSTYFRFQFPLVNILDSLLKRNHAFVTKKVFLKHCLEGEKISKFMEVDDWWWQCMKQAYTKVNQD